MDKNQFIGLTLISLMIIVYIIFFKPEPLPTENTQKTDTTANIIQDNKEKPQQIISQTPTDTKNLGSWAKFAKGKEETFTVENTQLKVTFSSKGGTIAEVLLKEYKDQNGKPLVLFNRQNNSLKLDLPLPNGKKVNLYDLYFQTEAPWAEVVKQGDSTQILFVLKLSEKQRIEQIYTLKEKGFSIGYSVNFIGLGQEIAKQPVVLDWVSALQNTEADFEGTRIKSTVNYYTAEGDFNYLGETSTDNDKEEITEPLHWVGFKQKFFTMAVIAPNNNFQKSLITQSTPLEDTQILKIVSASIQIPASDFGNKKSTFNFYFGPNRYQTLRQVTDGFYKNVDLGWPVINLLTRFVVVPLFSFLEGFIGNYGLIIIIMVFVIRGVLFPLSYKSYLSMAKMRALKPEMDAVKERVGDDPAKLQSEQMKLYNQVGINPLSGCIPVLLQMPVLFAMFTFFPNAIELRQEGFLWATDLSIYDSIASLPFEIPFYGDHVSLFTILMTLSTILLTYYNNQNTPTTMQGGIDMKTVGYVMPVVFMFVLNSFPAGLSFYYLVSNIFGVAQQLIIRNFVDDEKILAILEKNKVKNKDKKKSPFMQRLEEAMKAQEDVKKRKENPTTNKKNKS